MARNRPPSFQFYPASWIADTLLMSPDKRGRYITALSLSWLESSYGVATEDQWRRWLGYTPKQWPAVRDEFAARFSVAGEVWTQKRLVECRAEQVERQERASRGGQARNNQGGKGVSSKPTDLAVSAQVVANASGVVCLSGAIGVLGECLMPTPASASASASVESEPKSSCPPPVGGGRESGEAAEKKRQARQDRKEWEETFPDFWEEYPLRGDPPRKDGKAEALKAWNKIEPTEANAKAIWRALDLAKVAWTDPKFIPMAATWLNKGRWRDGEV